MRDQGTVEGIRSSEVLTDEQLLEEACETAFCTNWREEGYAICIECRVGIAEKMPHSLAVRKLHLDKGNPT